MLHKTIALFLLTLCGIAGANPQPSKPVYLTCSGTESYLKISGGQPNPWNIDVVVDIQNSTVNGEHASISDTNIVWSEKPANGTAARFVEQQCYLGRVGLHLQCFMAPDTEFSSEGNADCQVTEKRI